MVQLATSHLSFLSLPQLVAFYSLSRDVLPVCLLIPAWISRLTDPPERQPVLLGPKSWLCPPPADVMSTGTSLTLGNVVCSIQLTTSSGALAVLNPLYFLEHGDDWFTQSQSGLPGSQRKERRLSVARKRLGAGLRKERGISLDEALQNHSVPECADTSLVSSEVPPPSSPSTSEKVVLRRPSRSSLPDPVWSSGLQSPCRVSWIEDRMWLSPPPPPSLLHPPSLELDSLSISSVEEEPESLPSPTQSHVARRQLANKVKNRLSAVGNAIGGLMSPQKRLNHRVQELSRCKGGAFAEAVRRFVDQTLKIAVSTGMSCAELLQEVRASLTGLRDSLLDHAEISSLVDVLGDLSDSELDAMLELSLHKVALKPVSSHLYSCIRASRLQDMSLQRLQTNQQTLKGRSVEALEGTAGAGVPDAVTMERIQQRWVSMHQAYSPSTKVQVLLKVCKSIYHSMNSNAKPGVVFGADDFLPCLTWVLLHSDVTTLQTDTDYMMELLDPVQLQGEGGYYLTSLYAALFYISSFRPLAPLAARQLSAEAQQSLNQWHRRRTLHCNQSRQRHNRQTIRRHVRRGDNTKEATETSDNQVKPSGGGEGSLQAMNKDQDSRKTEEAPESLVSRDPHFQCQDHRSTLSTVSESIPVQHVHDPLRNQVDRDTQPAGSTDADGDSSGLHSTGMVS
ncbi:ras and Rab interactor 2 isoform X2 [Denticeps clupeoides]|uniref:ras and Rab interactor 2 isoform X2 n=1 Tax=Denticeps clupeoides TaxID=299321 RepID=UPI0010A35CD2|nr:ras and Rab interactor-like protein isoform X2 [Denticeps clupeoides]XP_028856732.1 ras and Rab interactor-like protein isoform X2 [Denticeps clupeoides]